MNNKHNIYSIIINILYIKHIINNIHTFLNGLASEICVDSYTTVKLQWMKRSEQPRGEYLRAVTSGLTSKIRCRTTLPNGLARARISSL